MAAAFPPHVLREYSFIADGERGALIGPRGDLTWLCAPRWDSDAVFSQLVGGPGVYAVHPAAERYVWGGYYEPRSLIWRSRWATTDGIVECREALAYPARPDRAVLLRRVHAVDCATRIDVVLEPAAGFGTDRLRDTGHEGGVWTGRTGALHMRWSGARGARRRGEALTLSFRLAPGETRDLVLELSEHEPDGPPPDPDRLWRTTEFSWRKDVPELPDTWAGSDAQHAYTVLRGLTSAGGGMVAAATTSLPERAEEGRNYDYRYVWIRDQCYAGQAVAVTEPFPLLDDAVRFVATRLLEDGPGLRPAYTTLGGQVPDERRLSHLEGYPGGSDRTGNWVNQQLQLDAFGEAMLLFAAAARHDHLDSEHWRAAEVAVAAVQQHWTKPDAGIWELDARHWAHSRLSCVAGLRALSAHASAAQAGSWTTLADTILAATAADCLHPTGRWQRAPDDSKVDAALLLPAVRGALPADDSRTVATLEAVREELTYDHFVYRFRHRPGPLGDAEGAFVLCGFLMALAEQQQGNAVAAVRFFERNRAACGPPGLFSEEYDVAQRQLRGNLPQAFVHALLLEAASRLGADPAMA